MRFQYLTYFRNISRFILYFKFIKMSLKFQYLYFKRFSLYFIELACHSRGQSFYGNYSNLDNKPEIVCNNINRGNRKYVIKTWQSRISDFWISKYLCRFLNEFHRMIGKHQSFCEIFIYSYNKLKNDWQTPNSIKLFMVIETDQCLFKLLLYDPC